MSNESPIQTTLSLNPTIDDFLSRLEACLREIPLKRNLPTGCVGVKKNVGKTVTSYSIQIIEEFHPASNLVAPALFTILNFKFVGAKSSVPRMQFNLAMAKFNTLPLASKIDAEMMMPRATNANQSPVPYCRVNCSIDSEVLIPFLLSLVESALDGYRTNQPQFGCCHRYDECSNVRKCIHPNMLYSTACSYRANLESGRVFYGSNKNV